MIKKSIFIIAAICILIAAGIYYVNNKGVIIQARTNEKSKTSIESQPQYNKPRGILQEKDVAASWDSKPKSIEVSQGNNPQQVNKSKKTIVIDPGHANRSNLEKEPIAPGASELKIKDGGGAEGIVTKTPEYKINMEVAVRLKSILESKGYTVVMTKTDNSKSLSNIERAEVGNKVNANLVVRLHADSSEESSTKGASMLIPAPINDNTKAIYDESKRIGKKVLDIYTEEMGVINRGVVEHNDMTGFNWSKVPVILIEMGFLSNPDEDRLLSNSEYQSKIASSLADGIAKALDR